jgi:hypothetical protein
LFFACRVKITEDKLLHFFGSPNAFGFPASLLNTKLKKSRVGLIQTIFWVSSIGAPQNLPANKLKIDSNLERPLLH